MSPVPASTNITGVASTILYLVNFVIVPVIFALAFIVFIWGIARAYILSQGEESKVEEGHRLMLWGLIGFVVMLSLWGLVNIVSNTFGLSRVLTSQMPTVPVSGSGGGGSTQIGSHTDLLNLDPLPLFQ